ncbi:unnamed protein product [Polarella glacialis]|uniref:Helicase-associated domain-containing protein n=1 Tax=Polarella glacialis TaxID=89957 RepID=A0A813FA89_POLGL|nr:unnamed protein product [Polarella glacialis]
MRNQARDLARLSDEQFDILREGHPLVKAKFDAWIQQLTSCTNAYASRCEQLAAFMKLHDRLPRHRGETNAEHQLAFWLTQQRQAFAKLSSTQRFALESVHPKIAQLSQKLANPMGKFGLRCEALRQFIEQHGKFPSPKGEDDEEIQLGLWLARQRTRLKTNALTEDKVRLLRHTHEFVSDRVDHWQDPMCNWQKNNNRCVFFHCGVRTCAKTFITGFQGTITGRVDWLSG